MNEKSKITRAEAVNASNIIKDFCRNVDDCNDDCPFSIVNPHGTWECGLMKDPSRWRFERFSESEKKYAEALAIIGAEAVTRLNGKLYCIFGDDNKIGIKNRRVP